MLLLPPADTVKDREKEREGEEAEPTEPAAHILQAYYMEVITILAPIIMATLPSSSRLLLNKKTGRALLALL